MTDTKTESGEVEPNKLPNSDNEHPGYREPQNEESKLVTPEDEA